MADLKVFRITPSGVAEVPTRSAAIERSLQRLFEANLEALLGVRFLASEYGTGKAHGGRIDTLGIDENGCPVIIEYKRAVNENVINQGLFYLDWLLDHRKEFQWLVMERLGAEAAKAVEWSAPRLLCIAGDFTNYDQHAVKLIDRTIELIRYRHGGDDLLLLELVNATTATPAPATAEPAETRPAKADGEDAGIVARLAKANPPLLDLYEAVKAYLLGLGDDVQFKALKHYHAFKRIKNFACIEVLPQVDKITIYLKVDPETIHLEPGFTRDARAIGHHGTGDLGVTLHTLADLDRATPLFLRSYENS